MQKDDPFPFIPKRGDAGVKSTEGDDAVFAWFSPVDDPETRFKYAVIKEENGIVSIEPGEGRFKKGLKAARWASNEADECTTWLVLKTKSNRIDLKQAD